MKHVASFLPLLAAFALSAATDRASTPNIVIVFCDDLGYADVGCFGAKGWTTPNIDRLAREGIRFTRFYDAPPGSTRNEMTGFRKTATRDFTASLTSRLQLLPFVGSLIPL